MSCKIQRNGVSPPTNPYKPKQKINNMENTKANELNQKIKDIIIEYCSKNEKDFNAALLNADIFNPVTMPLVDALLTLKEDAIWALDDKWDRSDDGFEAQIQLIDNVI